MLQMKSEISQNVRALTKDPLVLKIGPENWEDRDISGVLISKVDFQCIVQITMVVGQWNWCDSIPNIAISRHSTTYNTCNAERSGPRALRVGVEKTNPEVVQPI